MDHTITSGEQTLMVQTPPNDMNLEVSSQKDCPILSILPLKVRQRIWTMCLGGSTIVLTFSPENIHNMIDNDQRLKSLYRFGAEGLPKKGRSGRRLLAILLTCKQVNSEAGDILYSHNLFFLPRIDIVYLTGMFLFCSGNYLHYLDKLLVPQHLNAIRFLTFTIQFKNMYNDPEDETPQEERDQLRLPWTLQWKNLAAMEGVRELRVRITVPPDERQCWLEEEMSLLEPIKEVTKPTKFVLILPYADPSENESALQELPCEIQRAAK